MQVSGTIKNEAATVIRPALGLGYRPELAFRIDKCEKLGFVEILAEDFHSPRCVSQALKNLRKRGLDVLVHSVSLSLGGAERVDLKRVKHLASLANYFESPLVSDHIAFVRAGHLESGHLLPLRRTEAGLAVLLENIAIVKEHLAVPLVLENIAVTFDWPDNEMNEVEFVSAVLSRSDCGLLLDVSNLFANSHNLNFNPLAYLRELPLERLSYVHVAGGVFKQGLYHDTHCHPLKEQSLKLLGELKKITNVPRVMLERDDDFPPPQELLDELEAIDNA